MRRFMLEQRCFELKNGYQTDSDLEGKSEKRIYSCRLNAETTCLHLDYEAD